jgi:hypothetical protein
MSRQVSVASRRDDMTRHFEPLTDENPETRLYHGKDRGYLRQLARKRFARNLLWFGTIFVVYPIFGTLLVGIGLLVARDIDRIVALPGVTVALAFCLGLVAGLLIGSSSPSR